jgi:hypothetical protein
MKISEKRCGAAVVHRIMENKGAAGKWVFHMFIWGK